MAAIQLWFRLRRAAKYPGCDLGQLVDTRERRQIVGDFTLSPMDMLLGRTFPDTVVISRSNFDTHGFIVHPLFMLRPPDRADVDVRVPYRCLLPRGVDGLLVTGLGVSAHRDAVPVIRMQADVQNQGYAAGVAAAWIAQRGGTTRELDLKALQRHLVEKGNLPESVLTETDSFPLSPERVAQAVTRLTNNYDGLEVVLAQFDTAQPRLRQPGMNGHARGDIAAAVKNVPRSDTDTSQRNLALSELVLARALYRCGDHAGLGAGILRQYAGDLHGHYARHAQAVLAGQPGQ